jgi:hypothetical protein
MKQPMFVRFGTLLVRRSSVVFVSPLTINEKHFVSIHIAGVQHNKTVAVEDNSADTIERALNGEEVAA